MVCLGNICRSPMAEGILRKKASEKKINILIDSAGTGNWHVGENPDPRAIATAKRFGVDISALKARQFSQDDFEKFDQIFAMDKNNLKNILSLARDDHDKNKVKMLLDILPDKRDKNVPDPWFGGDDGFFEVYHLLEKACETYLNSI